MNQKREIYVQGGLSSHDYDTSYRRVVGSLPRIDSHYLNNKKRLKGKIWLIFIYILNNIKYLTI